MRIPIVDLDAIGIVQDVSPHDLPLNAWSDGRNMRVVDGRTEKISGQDPAFTPTVDPLWLLPVKTPAHYFWLYLSAAKAYAYESGTSSNITRAVGGDYSAVGNCWTGGMLNGVAIANNPFDKPQAWISPLAATHLVDLTNWPATWLAKSVRPFGNFLVALGVSKAGVANPYSVNWSHPADPGAVPISWDETDPAVDTGEVTLADTGGIMVDQLPLKNANIIYKEDCCYAMQYIGGNDIFAFPKLFKNVGLLMPNGVKGFSFRGDKHVVFGPDDIHVHDGSSSDPILSGRMNKWLYNNLDSTNYANSFIVHNPNKKEIWICFPEVGQTYASLALIWNYKDNTTTIRDLPMVSFGEIGQMNDVTGSISADSWSSDSGTWDSDNSSWGYAAYQPTQSRLVFGKPGASRATYVADLSTTFAGTQFTSYIERVGLTIIGQDRNGKPIEDLETVKLLTEIWPRVEGDAGVTINVYAGTQMARDQAVEWHGPYPFVIGTDLKVNPLVRGKLLGVRFSATTDASWRIHGYDITVQPIGGY
jgi:hypothetical protein